MFLLLAGPAASLPGLATVALARRLPHSPWGIPSTASLARWYPFFALFLVQGALIK